MKKQTGLTLIELMIALTLGLIIIAAVMNIYISSIRSSADTLNSARLNHDVDMAMGLMRNDIKRAGFWGGAVLEADSRTNPFTTATTDVAIFNLASPTTAITGGAGNCILYSYDANGDGVVDDGTGGADSEYFGFRLNGNVLQMRLSGTTTADCSDGTWQSILDDTKINVTDLQFSFVAMAQQAAVANVHPTLPALTATSRCVNNVTDVSQDGITACDASGNDIGIKRVVNIHLTAYVDEDDDDTVDTNEIASKTLSESITLRNSRLYTAP